jgi:hypothetical protein
MKATDIKITVADEPDISDPLNKKTVVFAKATVDGALCGWKATAVGSQRNSAKRKSQLEAAIALLVEQIIGNPQRPLVIDGGVDHLRTSPEVIVEDDRMTGRA